MKTFRDTWLRYYKQHRKDGLRPQQAKIHAMHDARYNRSAKTYVLPGYPGDTQTMLLPNNWTVKFKMEYDQDHEIPWECRDGMGVVEAVRYRGSDCASYWPLGEYNVYDWEASFKEALRDGWDAKPYGQGTKREQAMRAVKSTYEYLRRWCNDQWYYVGLIVTLYDADENKLDTESCWGYESEAEDYMCSEVRGWAARMIRKARRAEREAARQEKISTRFADAMNCGV